jgi:hypothetical protein
MLLLLLLQGQPAVLALDAVPIPLAHATHFPLTNKQARKLSRASNSSIDRYSNTRTLAATDACAIADTKHVAAVLFYSRCRILHFAQVVLMVQRSSILCIRVVLQLAMCVLLTSCCCTGLLT